MVPSVRSATGSGSQRLYSFKDILVLKVVKRLLDTGVSLQNIRRGGRGPASARGRRPGPLTLLSDGTTVYECTSAEEVVDLLRGGQGVFGIAVSGALRELAARWPTCPAERADGRRGDRARRRRPATSSTRRRQRRTAG